ncbi:MAG: hypothetical protein Q4F00_06985 [bacterium]|nr:hypothetical protein [bacterium]
MKMRSVLMSKVFFVLTMSFFCCFLASCQQRESSAQQTVSVPEKGAAAPICGGGAADEAIDFSENAVFIESVAIYEEGVQITEDNRLLNDLGSEAQPIKELAIKAANSPFIFVVIGRDSKGRYVELPNDRHTSVGWANSEDFSKYIEIGSDSRSLIYKNAHPEIMTLIVSYQTVPGSSTPVQARLDVSNYPDRLH